MAIPPWTPQEWTTLDIVVCLFLLLAATVIVWLLVRMSDR